MTNVPTYRVDFWQPVSPGDPATGRAVGYQRDSYYISEADIGDVTSWADESANGRIFVIWVTSESNGEPGLIRLSGRDPTSHREV